MNAERLKWVLRPADQRHSGFHRRVIMSGGWTTMARHLGRYRNQTLLSLAVLTGCVLLAVDAWSTGHSWHLALTHVAALIAMVGTARVALRWRRAMRGAQEVDFATGIADYRMRDFELRRHSA